MHYNAETGLPGPIARIVKPAGHTDIKVAANHLRETWRRAGVPPQDIQNETEILFGQVGKPKSAAVVWTDQELIHPTPTFKSGEQAFPPLTAIKKAIPR
jgi:hypothetical protein